jgi:hypothetical protein
MLLPRDPSHLCLSVLLGLGLGPLTASAQPLRRLSFSLDGTVGTMVTAPQSEQYGFGFSVSARPRVRLAGSLGVHLLAGYAQWSSRQEGLANGTLTSLGGGVDLHHALPRGRGTVLAELEAAYSSTGRLTLQNLQLGVGFGWLFPVLGWLSLGPIARYGQVLYNGDPAEVRQGLTEPGSGTVDARFWSLGLRVEAHLPPPPPGPPPPAPPPPQ